MLDLCTCGLVQQIEPRIEREEGQSFKQLSRNIYVLTTSRASRRIKDAKTCRIVVSRTPGQRNIVKTPTPTGIDCEAQTLYLVLNARSQRSLLSLQGADGHIFQSFAMKENNKLKPPASSRLYDSVTLLIGVVQPRPRCPSRVIRFILVQQRKFKRNQFGPCTLQLILVWLLMGLLTQCSSMRAMWSCFSKIRTA